MKLTAYQLDPLIGKPVALSDEMASSATVVGVMIDYHIGRGGGFLVIEHMAGGKIWIDMDRIARLGSGPAVDAAYATLRARLDARKAAGAGAGDCDCEDCRPPPRGLSAEELAELLTGDRP